MNDNSRSASNADAASFGGQALEGADFSGQDLRGADFTGADLRRAGFRDTKLGVPPVVGVVLLGVGMIIAVCAGGVIGWAVDGLRNRITADHWDEMAEGSTMALIVVILLGVIIWKGFDLALKSVVVAYLSLLVVNIIANAIWDEVEYVRALRATAFGRSAGRPSPAS